MILGDETGLLKSFRNIPRVDVMEVGAVGVVDVIGAASIVISEGALEVLASRPAVPRPRSRAADEKDGE